MKKRIFVLAISVILLSCSIKDDIKKISVFHAGSLAKPFREMKIAFEELNPNVEVLLEAAGSRTCARKITDLNRIADVMASADHSIIHTLLMPKFASYNINFVANEMVIMYNEQSKFSDIISEENWIDILLNEKTEYGHSDPNKDPCGYRTLLFWQLAEKYYKRENLYQRFQDNRPIKNIRPKGVDLLALLETGELDYLFIYKSLAVQHNAKYIELPKQINLGSNGFREYYNSARVEIDGKSPGKKITKFGEPMVYGITVPTNAKNPKLGEKFIEFILSKKGQEIMKRNGHPLISPAESEEYKKLPESLKKLSIQI